MPVTKNTFSKCGHKGLGAHCHRCAEAERLTAIAEGKARPVKGFKGWSKEQFLALAAHLRQTPGGES